jgi:quinol monooxygenase YgiN
MYRLQPSAGEADRAREALRELARIVEACPGCVDAQGFTETDGQGLMFIERWRSPADYEAARAHLPPNAFSALGKMLAGPPQVSVLESL